VWAFLGDGECDEPEALGALSLAGREGLENLIFVVNCNLQRLDGPVRGDGKIIQELESDFRGAGWNVIKVVWGREWDDLLARDVNGLLVQKMFDTVDGEYQRYSVETGAYIRERFFGPDPELRQIVEHLSDSDLENLRRGGHDYRKLYAAYKLATETKGQPTVILAKTIKGWTLGKGVEARNITHQAKKLEEDELRKFRDRLQLPIPDDKLGDAPYYHPGPGSEEVRYMLERRRALGGVMPRRKPARVSVKLPEPDLYAEFLEGTDEKIEVSTTMAFVRMLRKLMKHPGIGSRVVPIIPDEARTFGMEALFSEFKIYAPYGQKYTPVDAEFVLKYAEGKDGQILEEGITEAGSLASFTAASTSHASHGKPVFPFFMFYSMFGFQRVGDLIWSMADQRGRGFLIGATAGRTTLQGEGLQHDDGHSHVVASTVPACLAYDPAYAYEVAVIVREGLRRMWEANEDVFYYLTLYNETYRMPAMPHGAEEGIVRGLYRFRPAPASGKHHAQILASGPIVNEGVRAQGILADRFDVSAAVWSAPSFPELRREALRCERWNRLHPGEPPRIPYVTRCLRETKGPIVASTDYMKQLPDMVGRWVPRDYTVLGTDGFGRSDTREALRRYFEIDAEHIVVAVLAALAREGAVRPEVVARAIKEFEIEPEALDPASPDPVREAARGSGESEPTPTDAAVQ
jgi:pyruvate dehydrogenase E1 component